MAKKKPWVSAELNLEGGRRVSMELHPYKKGGKLLLSDSGLGNYELVIKREHLDAVKGFVSGVAEEFAGGVTEMVKRLGHGKEERSAEE